METAEVIKRNRKKFDRSRLMVKVVLVMVFVMIAAVQHRTIINIFNWLFGSE